MRLAKFAGLTVLLLTLAALAGSSWAGDNVLFAGGLGPNGASALIYSGVTNKFAKKPRTMNAGRWYNSATVLNNGKVLLVGGLDSPDGKALASAELYDPRMGKFEKARKTPSLTEAAGPVQTATLLADGNVLIAAPQDPLQGDSFPGGPTQLYDPKRNSFSDTDGGGAWGVRLRCSAAASCCWRGVVVTDPTQPALSPLGHCRSHRCTTRRPTASLHRQI